MASYDRVPPTSMRIKLKYPDVETFIQKYAVNISRGGIFIATKQPKPVGTVVRFEFLLANAQQTSLIRGEGQVQWTREYDPAAPTKAHGMGVKFSRLDGESQAIVERALAWRASHGMGKKDSEGITVASVAPPGATPEPQPLPADLDRTARGSVERGFDREDEEPTRLQPPRDEADEPTRTQPPRDEADEPTRTQPPRGDDEDEVLPTQRRLETIPATTPMPPMPTSSTAPTMPTTPTTPAGDRTLRTFDSPRPDAPVVARTVRGDPTVLERPPLGRELEQQTRPVTLPDAPPMSELRDRQTRPIELPDAPPPAADDATGEVKLPESPPVIARDLDDSVRIALERHRTPKNGKRHGDELDQMIADWKLQPERVEQLLRKKRPRIGAQATAELERLMRKPPKLIPPSKQDAVRLLDELLSGRPHAAPLVSPPVVDEPPRAEAQAAGGEPEPSDEAEPPPRRKRAR